MPSVPSVQFYKERIQLQDESNHQSKKDETIERLNKKDLYIQARRTRIAY